MNRSSSILCRRHFWNFGIALGHQSFLTVFKIDAFPTSLHLLKTSATSTSPACGLSCGTALLVNRPRVCFPANNATSTSTACGLSCGTALLVHRPRAVASNATSTSPACGLSYGTALPVHPPRVVFLQITLLVHRPRVGFLEAQRH